MPYHDLTELKEMAMGNEEFVQKMIHVFLETTQESLTELLDAFEKGDFDTVSTLAHKIKPSIDIMGIKALQDPIRAIETNAKATGDQLAGLVPKLDHVLSSVFDELK
jgi:HPt (histidine-containing phosphotransfer) domain-containing protein